MSEENTITLHSLSVVILAEQHNPSIINPDFVKYNKIIPEKWQITQTITTPGLSVLKYDNNVQLVVEPNSLNISQDQNESFQKDANSEIYKIATQYVKALPHIPYSRLGLNCVVSMIRNNSQEWLTKRFLKTSSQDTKLYMMPKFIITNKEYVINLVFSSRKNNEVVVNCNVHYNGKLDHALLSQRINEWPSRQKDIKRIIDNLIQGGE